MFKRQRPFSLDRPGAEALMIWIVPSKMTVLNEPQAIVTTAICDAFVLAHCGGLPELEPGRV
jgi:hypothetical protein